jgi:hypothetical protein
VCFAVEGEGWALIGNDSVDLEFVNSFVKHWHCCISQTPVTDQLSLILVLFTDVRDEQMSCLLLCNFSQCVMSAKSAWFSTNWDEKLPQDSVAKCAENWNATMHSSTKPVRVLDSRTKCERIVSLHNWHNSLLDSAAGVAKVMSDGCRLSVYRCESEDQRSLCRSVLLFPWPCILSR